jgi:threonine/homoserine/homoserine lactone efflux protein
MTPQNEAQPGPATLSSAAAGAAYRLRAVPYVIGISLGTMTVIVLVAAGVTGLVTSIPGAAPVISVLAGGYILYLAYRIATAPPVGALDHQAMAPPLIGGYALAIANPKAYGAMGALFSGFPIVQDDPVAGGILKVVILSVFALAVNTTWMSVGAGLARAMQNPRTSRMLNVTFSLLLACHAEPTHQPDAECHIFPAAGGVGCRGVSALTSNRPQGL